jgi:hypothetical protein
MQDKYLDGEEDELYSYYKDSSLVAYKQGSEKERGIEIYERRLAFTAFFDKKAIKVEVN